MTTNALTTCRLHPNVSLIEDHRRDEVISAQCDMAAGERMADLTSEWRTISNGYDHKGLNYIRVRDNHFSNCSNLDLISPLRIFSNSVRPTDANGPQQMSSECNSLQTVSSSMQYIAACTRLPTQIIDRALSIFKECHENKCVRNYSQDVIIAACVYTACRKEGLSRTIKEICDDSKCSSAKSVGQCFKQIMKTCSNTTRMKRKYSRRLVLDFCKKLKFLNLTLIRKTAICILTRARQIFHTLCRAQDSIVAVAIYMSCAAVDEMRTMNDIAIKSGVREKSIRNVYQQMLPKAAELFPGDFVFTCPITSFPRS